jgi:phage baseplate assembly protein W
MTRYTDLNKDFGLSFKNSKVTVEDITVIKKNLERLFNTGKGEVPFNRNYGTSLKSLLFENNLDPSEVSMFLYMDITECEPRVDLSPVDINITKLDVNTYNVDVTFRIPDLNNVIASVSSTIIRDR